MIDIEAIEARASKASPAPWECDRNDSLRWPVYIVTKNYKQGLGFFAPADAKFIAHSRQDVRDLIAEVKRLREALGKLNKTLEDEWCEPGHDGDLKKPGPREQWEEFDFAWEAVRKLLDPTPETPMTKEGE